MFSALQGEEVPGERFFIKQLEICDIFWVVLPSDLAQ